MMRHFDVSPKLIRREPLKHDTLLWDRPGRRDYHEIHKPTPFELGLTVTIGIAVKPLLGDFIVTVSDQRQSFDNELQPVEGLIKVARLSKKWGFLFAGAVGHVRAIRRKAVAILGDPEEDKTYDDVSAAVARAYHEVANEIIRHRYLARFGFESVTDFRRHSTSQLGEKPTDRIAARIEKFDFNMQLLVFGFEETGFAKFIEINRCGVVDCSEIDAWAIGSGTYLALGSLNARYRGEQSIARTIKEACEAKFSAEFSDGVGRYTSVYVWYIHGNWYQMTNRHVDQLRTEWERERATLSPGRSEQIVEAAFSRDPEFSFRMAAWREMISQTQSA